MPWNSAVNGDWSQADFSKAPWVGGVMELTHDEVMHVKTETQVIIESYILTNGTTPPDNEWVVPRYNELDWEKCINGDTYAVIKQYDPEFCTMGIGADGQIIMPEEPIEEPTTIGEGV